MDLAGRNGLQQYQEVNEAKSNIKMHLIRKYQVTHLVHGVGTLVGTSA
jgi:hypothetical protein